MPRIDECYINLHDAVIFTTLDLKSGYWPVRLDDDANAKTAFTCRYGHFQFRVMPFGLTSAPTTFQTMMNDILRDYIDDFVMVYLDDIVIYSRSIDEHESHVKKVLTALAKENLVLNLGKCTWAQDKLLHLGHFVSGKGIQVNPEKVKAVLQWPIPTTITHLRGFLNLAGYYRRFVRDFAKIALPLTNLLAGAPKKGSGINWSPKCERAFHTLKNALCNTKVLIHPIPWTVFVID